MNENRTMAPTTCIEVVRAIKKMICMCSYDDGQLRYDFYFRDIRLRVFD